MARREVLFVAVVVLALCGGCLVSALDNGLARTPQMGWNSWNLYGCNINESLIANTAQAMVSSGLYKFGYTYVNIDDCWGASTRDSQGRLQANPVTFPSGIAALASKVHALGLKFGIYSDAGTATCQGVQPGSLGNETIDAQTFASWGVDYLKYDNCNNQGIPPQERYPPMSAALNATGRPILFSMCEWGQDQPATWAPPIGNSWRTTGDISDRWHSMLRNLDLNDRWAAYAGPGAWNDPDMLEVGNGGMTDTEYKSHFSLWCLVKAPLIIGTNIMNMTSSTYTILTNSEAIAVNQDPLGVQGKLLASNIDLRHEVWGGPLSGGNYAVILFNRGISKTKITVQFKYLGLPANTTLLVRDLWAHDDVGDYTDSFSANVGAHDVVFIKLSPVTAAN